MDFSIPMATESMAVSILHRFCYLKYHLPFYARAAVPKSYLQGC